MRAKIISVLIAILIIGGIYVYFGSKTETFQKWNERKIATIDKELLIANQLFLIAEKQKKAFSEIAPLFSKNENFKAINKHPTEMKEKMAGAKKALENLRKNNVLIRITKQLFHFHDTNYTDYKFTHTLLSIDNTILGMYISNAYASMLNLASDPKSSIVAVVTNILNIQKANIMAAEALVCLYILEPQLKKK